MSGRPLDEDARRWFGQAELAGASPAALAVVVELLQTLDGLEPSLIDSSRSTIRSQGHDWTVSDAVEIRLAHREDAEATITLVVATDHALVSWITAHEHVYVQDATGERPWTKTVVDVAAAILRGEYEVENTYKGSRLVKTRVIDVAQGRHERTVDITGTLISSWFPLPRRKRVERHRIDFGVTDS